MDITPGSRTRLDGIMNARRLDLGLTWREVALRGGLSYEVVRSLRTGPGGVTELTMRKIDKGLAWKGGSVERVLDGGDPAECEAAAGASLAVSDEEAAVVEAAFVRAAEKAAAQQREDGQGQKRNSG